MILTIVPSRGMYSSFHSIAKTLHLFFGWFFFKWEGSCCLAATGLKLPGCLVLLFFPYLSLLLIFCFLHRGLRYCPWYVAAEVFFISCSVTLLKHNLPALPAVPTPASSKVHQGTCPRGEAPVLTPAQWRAAGAPCCHLSKRLHPPPLRSSGWVNASVIVGTALWSAASCHHHLITSFTTRMLCHWTSVLESRKLWSSALFMSEMTWQNWKDREKGCNDD